MWDLSSPIRDWTYIPYIGSAESQPLSHQASPAVHRVYEVHQGCRLSLCLFNFYAENIMPVPDWISQSWNQDCREKYQQSQICRWYHSNGRKWKGTKEPLDEGERGEWKSWLETQHFKKLRSWYPVPSLHGKQKGKKWKQWQILFSWDPKSLWTVILAMKLKDGCSLEEKLWQI